MNPSSYNLQAFWTAREESTRACATRMARMLSALAALHPVFRCWYQQAWTLEEAFVPFCKMPPQVDELGDVFKEGRFFTDVSHELMPALGYSVGAWNGIEGSDGVSLRVHAGAYSDRRPFPNDLHMTVHGLGGYEPGKPEFINAKFLKAVLLTIVDAWEPSWASISDHDYFRHLKLERGTPFFSGWMTYLSASYARKITPSAAAVTEPVAGGGVLMLATNEPFSLDNPQHVAVADAIQASLEPLQSTPRLT
jgi:hypothetical protein